MKKIIVTTVTSALLIIIAITTLVLALIPVNQNSLIARPDSIYMFNKETSDMPERTYSLDSLKEKEKKELNKIYELFNENFGQKLLTAIFRGEVNDKMESFYEKPKAGEWYTSNQMKKNYDTSEKITIVFNYNQKRTLKTANKTFEYSMLFFELDGNAERSLITFGVNDNKGELEMGSSLSYDYGYRVKTSLKNVYDYVAQLFKEIEKPVQ